MGPFLTPDGQLIASTLNEAQAAAWCLESLAAQDEQATAAAVLGGRDGMTEAIPSLAALLDDDGLLLKQPLGHWVNSGLKTLLDLTVDGSLDERENAFAALPFHRQIPETAAAAGLTQDLHLALDRELERAKSGRTGLCEYACRALATLGDPQSKDAIQRVIDNDPSPTALSYSVCAKNWTIAVSTRKPAVWLKAAGTFTLRMKSPKNPKPMEHPLKNPII